MNANHTASSPVLAWLRRLSRRAWWLHVLLMGQLCLLPCPVSHGLWVDTDGDGVVDLEVDDGDLEAGAAEPVADADGDGLTDDEERDLGSDLYNPDSDYDGLTDADEVYLTGTSPLLADSDGDGISDYNAFYGNYVVDMTWVGEGVSPYDWDGDGLHDPVDPDPFSAENIGDGDGDYVPDPEDSHPLDPSLWCDWNGNGVNDDAEVEGADSDGDGVSDETDSHPYDPNLNNDWNGDGIDDEHEDWDGDGVSNLQDSHPYSNILWCDWNGNGVNDDAEAAAAVGWDIVSDAEAGTQDSDGDGYADGLDSHADDPTLWNDHNGNGINDELEAPPDTDRDGIPDAWDSAPEDRDNDGLSDAEEWVLGTDPAEADSDGDGLSDGEELYAGTDPWNVDTDGDGLTDSEEIFAYHSDPLEPTAVSLTEGETALDEAAFPADAGAAPVTAGLRVSQWVPAPGTESGQRCVEHASGGSLAFPCKSAQKDKSDLSKTLILAHGLATPITGLTANLAGTDAGQFRVVSHLPAELAPGAECQLTVSFMAPTPVTQSRTATLTLYAGQPASPLFVLNLRSIVSSGIWSTHDDYFFADYTDSDGDGIPDLVEAMYAPLVVTATGDLDGDGVNNLDQYLAGRDLRDRAKSNDVDGDGLTNATEDAWNAAYPGKLNKYHFADAFADPDGDGLLTIEELTCTWGGQKDPHAVATHPFVASSAPPATAKTADYKISSRKPPQTPPEPGAATRASGPLLSRCSLYADWMNDGLLRRACHETAQANGGKLPSDFFKLERAVHASSAALQKIQGSDHLPRGYLAWLGRQTPAISVLSTTAPAPALSQLNQLHLPDAEDADADGMATVWEAAYDLDWRTAADSHLEHALESLRLRLETLAGDLADPVLNAEYAAVSEVRTRLLAAQSSWPAITYEASIGGQTQSVNTLLMPVYAVDNIKFPAALGAAAAKDEIRRATWIQKYSDALDWQIRASLDPDHDGLMNLDEYRQGLSPHLPDYQATGDRDSDGDGFIDAIELVTGTDHLNRSKKPVYAIEILTPAADLNGTALQPLALSVRTVLSGPKGSWPLGAQSVTATAPDPQCLLAWSQQRGHPDWHPQSAPAVATDDHGRATLYVNPGWKKGSLRLTLQSSPGVGLPAGLKLAKVVCTLAISAPADDTDADGLPDAWETRPARGSGDPAHALNKSSALDAEPGPQHFGYHPATPHHHLPAAVQALLNAWKTAEAQLGYLPEYPVTTATATPLAVPTNDAALQLAQHKILALVDPDHDGWSNFVEYVNGTNPRVPDNPATAARDTDGDGIPDALERLEGSNPYDAGSVPKTTVTDAKLRIVWGSDQGAAPGSLALQPITVQLMRGNDPLPQRAFIEASCLGSYLAQLAPGDKNVAWQPNQLKLVTDAQGRASFHFWTPANSSSQWQVRVSLANHPAVEARARINNTGGSGSTDGPGVTDQRPNNGSQLGFGSSYAPFVIRFVDWQGGSLGNQQDGIGDLPGSQPYQARIQKKKWQMQFGTPIAVNDGPAFVQDIGNQTADSAEAWRLSHSQASLSYLVTHYSKEWYGDSNGYGHSYSEIIQENPDAGTTLSLGKNMLATWVDPGEFDEYEPLSAEYHLPEGSTWQVVEAVWPVVDDDPVDPGNYPSRQVKHYYQHMAPSTFSQILDLDTRTQVVSVTGAEDVERHLSTRAVTLPIAERRLPNQMENNWDGHVATAIAKFRHSYTEYVEDAYTAQRTRGSLQIAWDPNYPLPLNEQTREAWLQRFLILRTEEIKRGDSTETRSQAIPLVNLLSLNTTQSAMLALDPGTLELGVEKRVTLSIFAWDLAIDANRDGTIELGEAASPEKPFCFWLNNDYDAGDGQGEEVSGRPDSADNTIANVRDLEDFHLLRFSIPEALLKAANRGDLALGLRWRHTSNPGPSIRVFRARSGIRSANDYVWGQDKAWLQLQGSRYTEGLATVAQPDAALLPDDLVYPSSHGLGYQGDPFLLFEGVQTGSGKLCLVIRLKDGSTVDGPGPWISLSDIKRMYVRNTDSQFDRRAAGDETKEVITFVHGWNMSPEGSTVFSETLFKRLWHQGYKGRFAAFRWNTKWSDAFDKVPWIGEAVEAYLAKYNDSEYIAWNSGRDLTAFLSKHPSSYQSKLVAHSMGNIVAGSALAQGLEVDKYILMQAAVPASCYDDSEEMREKETYKHKIFGFPDPTMWDKWTPDHDYDPEAYRGKLRNIGGEPTNFFQEEDRATSFAWEINNDLAKDRGVLAETSYGYDKSQKPGRRCMKASVSHKEGMRLETILTGYEALTKVCRSWGKAVGAKGATRGAIKNWVDNDAFGFGSEHSAQFKFPAQNCGNFYNALVTELDGGKK